MRKIDKLVFKAFAGPFAITFCVVVFIFLTQFLMNYFDELIGKDLGFLVYARLIFYFSLTMTPVALPLAILLACLITFGNLGEHFELTAIKSAGISLTRVLYPMLFFSIAMVFVSFWFNNNLIPKVNLKAYSLLYDIRQKKPALDFKDGIFYNGIPNYSIKVQHKDPETQELSGVLIYDHSEGKGNTKVILADRGYMETLNDGSYLKLTLFDGNMYNQNKPKIRRKNNEQYSKMAFAKNEIMFPLQSFDFQRTDENLFKPHRVMNNVEELNTKVDSFRAAKSKLQGTFINNIKSFYSYNLKHEKFLKRNINTEPYDKNGDFYFFDESDENNILRTATTQARNIKSFTNAYSEQMINRDKEIASHVVEKYKKFTFAVACLVMFLIGAPLGAIIKKGGLGVPVLVAIMFFVFYHVMSITGEKLAKESLVSIPQAMWTSNIVLFIIGLFFLYKARRDSALFDGDYYRVIFDKVSNLFKGIKS
ncbi:LptF/LptG family permease [Hyphobacterium sp. CCMP332]|nr:LptF/LptG family permease [Hyphobacterium sp. CCMP332]